MEKALELISAGQETFFYRHKNWRVINYRIVSSTRLSEIRGPLVYAVADNTGIVRYVGKWETETPLHARWIRHERIFHGKSTRSQYLRALDAGEGPLSVWSCSAEEISQRLPSPIRSLSNKDIAVGLEALWINRWRYQLAWNSKPEPVPQGFDDGNYWLSSSS